MTAVSYFFESHILFAVLLLAVGSALLFVGANLFVDGASTLAHRLHVPTMIVGLTIVALGTSLPETAVSAAASLRGSSELAVGNVVGSDFFNTLAVVGLCALIRPVPVETKTLRRDLPFCLFCEILLLACGAALMGLRRPVGAGFLALLVGYTAALVRQALRSRKEESAKAPSPKPKTKAAEDAASALAAKEEAPEKTPAARSLGCCLIMIFLGAAAIALGGDWTVDAARSIALFAGMSETLVALSIVSIGTSLPELAASVVAARRGEVNLALGNAIGSDIINILLVLGLSAVIRPVEILPIHLFDAALLLLVTLLLWLFTATGRRIRRVEGAVMAAAYAAYLLFAALR